MPKDGTRRSERLEAAALAWADILWLCAQASPAALRAVDVVEWQPEEEWKSTADAPCGPPGHVHLCDPRTGIPYMTLGQLGSHPEKRNKIRSIPGLMH